MSKLKKFLRRGLIIAGLSFSLGWGTEKAVGLGLEYLEKNTNEETKEYVTKNLDSLIEEQEMALGIEHFGKPRILFEPQEKDNIPLILLSVATYLPKNETIYYHVDESPGVDLTREDKFSHKILKFFYPNFISDVNTTMWHELGHYYTHQLAKNKSPTALKNLEAMNSEDESKFVGFKVLLEGIAEYFQKNTEGQKEDSFSEILWPDTLREKKWIFLMTYIGGYHLVKEVIDKYGERGILYMMENPPIVNNPRRDFEDYRIETLCTLAGEKDCEILRPESDYSGIILDF